MHSAVVGSVGVGGTQPFAFFVDKFNPTNLELTLLRWGEPPFYSQGTPKFGGFPQIWRNCKFQNWGIPPNLEKWLFFILVFGREEGF